MMDTQELVGLVNEIMTIGRYRIAEPQQEPNEVPRQMDCQDLVRHVSKLAFDREIFMVKTPSARVADLVRFIKEHPERYMWRIQEHPEHGGLVEMSHGLHPHHVGIWLDIDGGGILHCHVGGVGFDTVLALKAAGWRRFIFHGWNGA